MKQEVFEFEPLDTAARAVRGLIEDGYEIQHLVRLTPIGYRDRLLVVAVRKPEKYFD